MLFECCIRSTSKELFRKSVFQVRFCSLDEGEICIRAMHETIEKFLKTGKIVIDLDEKSNNAKGRGKIFFTGPGLAKMENNTLNIIAFPIVEQLSDAPLNLQDSYGNKYHDLWKNL